MTPPICFYHRVDLDGKCSGAVVRRAIPDVELRGYNYGDDFPWADVQGRDVILVDCSLQPFEDMERLSREGRSLTWIDHHASAIVDADKLDAAGIQRSGDAGCELAWEHYFPGVEMPLAVRLLGRYDVWDHEDPRTLPFQFGMRNVDNGPDDPVWSRLFAIEGAVARFVQEGETILSYQKRQNAAIAGSRSFDAEVFGLRAIVCNATLTNSQVFDSVWDPEHHDVMVTFSMLPTRRWTVSLYSTPEKVAEGVNCGALAKSMGGGGHAQAAGFQCDSLPFEI